MNNPSAARIGLLGGTFNPVHIGHLVLAQCAMETFDLSKTLLIPSAVPPHKGDHALASADHRIAMLERAVEDNLRFEVSDVEIRRGGTSYTLDTVREIRRENPASELVFIIGADSLLELHSWYRIEEVLQLCRVVTMARPGYPLGAVSESDLNLPSPWSKRLLGDIATGCMIDISSSMIRYRVAEGMSIRYLVPMPVDMYIAEHGLYR